MMRVGGAGACFERWVDAAARIKHAGKSMFGNKGKDEHLAEAGSKKG